MMAEESEPATILGPRGRWGARPSRRGRASARGIRLEIVYLMSSRISTAVSLQILCQSRVTGDHFMKVLAVVLALSGLTGAAPGAAEPVVVIRCGRLIDGRADQAVTGVTVQIVGERISAIGKGLIAPAGGRTVDLGDPTFLPGFIHPHPPI